MTSSIPASRRRLTLLWAVVMTLGWSVAQEPPVRPAATTPEAATAPPPTAPAMPPVSAPPPAAAQPGSMAGMLPGDYLDCVGQKVKARWRQLYRETPPAASSERLRIAFTLGCLMAESHLAVQAGDAQQFRNNNQEVLKLCSVLGLADKISSDLMASSKMAETEDWPALRKQVLQTQQRIETVLKEQRDEDPAILMGIGLWVRMLDISTSLVVADPDLQDKSLCIGSVSMLNELVTRYERLTEPSQQNESIAWIGGVLEMLQRHWTTAEGRPTPELVQMTFDKLKFLIGKVEAK
jgi:hypothetical protein